MRLLFTTSFILRQNCRQLSSSHEFVPKHKKATNYEIKVLQQFIDSVNRLLVMTGAGISTESGIPDYRSEGVGLYDRRGHKPIQHKDFLRSDAIRRRYWARNYWGWNRFKDFEPNVGHKCLTKWESLKKVHFVVTQNVDQLHRKAGTENIVELHGNAFTVRCLDCRYHVSRYLFQQMLNQLNEDIISCDVMSQSHELRPDGDIDIESEFVDRFQYPSCPRCDGLLKPDIVFFGDNVPKNRVNFVNEILRQSDALLIVGSSLHVFSGYRFALNAREDNKPIAVINIGTTRIDGFDNILRLNARIGDILPQIVI